MKTFKLPLLLVLLGLLLNLTTSAQDAITWSTQLNGAKLPIQWLWKITYL